MQTYVYIIAATEKGSRDHNTANADRLRFSLETMVQPAFLAGRQDRDTKQAALAQAQVLVICANAKSDLSNPNLIQALEAFREKEDGRIYVFGKNKSVSQKIEGAQFIRERAIGIDDLLRAILQMEDGDRDEFELARKMQEQMQEQQEEEAGADQKSNLGNILFICGFIAAVCLIFRIVIWARG